MNAAALNSGPHHRETHWRPGAIPLDAIRAALRERMEGIGLAADLALAPIDNLFDPTRSTFRFLAEPALYYANHQVSYESFLFSYLHAALTGVPLLVVTHPGLLHNDLGQHCALLAEHLHRLGHHSAHLVTVVAVPTELTAARRFLTELPSRLATSSLLVHVEGWRELHEGQRIHLMSRDLMEVTQQMARPVVPVRISGGLPGRAVGYRFHLPYRMSRIAFEMGEPIFPATLLAAPVSGRRRVVLDAINALAPPSGVAVGRANATLAKRCLRRHVESGSSALKCFLLEALETMADPSAETQRVLAFLRTGSLALSDVADPDWFARKVMWLTDGRGMKTVVTPVFNAA